MCLGPPPLLHAGGGSLDGGFFPHFNLVLVIVGAALCLNGASILARSCWTE